MGEAANTDWMLVWTAVGAIAACFLVFGVVFAFVQVRQARKSTSAQVAVGLWKELREKDVLNNLREIYELEPERIASLPNGTEKEDQELQNTIIEVLDKLELLGALVAQGIVNEGMAIVVYGGPTVLKCWHKLNGYINGFIRTKHHSLSCRYLEDFAARTWEHSYREGQKIYFYRVKEEEPIDLIKYFEDNPRLRPKRYEQTI